jgi:uncharacterized membrane protein YjjP (DUF1212 family)
LEEEMKDLLTCAMDIGEEMLVCGAEVHRVEDSIQRMCLAMGASRIDIFIITSSMVATVHTPEGETLTQTRRIKGTGTDIERLHRLNDLSRRICSEGLSLAEIREAYRDIRQTRSYPFWLECLSCAVIAGTFTLFFGGGIAEAVVSTVIGAVIRLLGLIFSKMVTNRIFDRFINSFVASVLAFVAMRLSLVGGVDKILIGNIMLLIPGIGLTNALRDLFTGDSIAGLLRSIEAGLMAIAIAAGYFLCAVLMGGA